MKHDNLIKYDRIKIESESDNDKIFNWANENYTRFTSDDLRMPILEGVIEFPEIKVLGVNMKSELYFNLIDGIKFHSFIDGEEVADFDLMDFGSFENIDLDNINFKYNKMNEEFKKKFIKGTILNFSYIMLYISNYEGDIVTEKKVRNVQKKKFNNKKKREGKRKVFIIKKRIFQIHAPYDDNSCTRSFQRHTESWTVRGHWRITKTGKRVWVKPHVKGIGDKKPKEYSI